MRQTCGQRSSKSAERKRRALGNYFSEQNYYALLVSKCTGGLCTTLGLAFGEPQRKDKIRFFLRRNTFFVSRHCASVLQTQVPKLYTDLDLSLLYILMMGTTRKNKFRVLGVCFPQSRSSAGRRFASSRSRLQIYRRIISFPQLQFR